MVKIWTSRRLRRLVHFWGECDLTACGCQAALTPILGNLVGWLVAEAVAALRDGTQD